MKVKDMKSIIQDLDDDVDIEVNSVWDDDEQELTPVACEAFYHEKDNKVYITPETIALQDGGANYVTIRYEKLERLSCAKYVLKSEQVVRYFVCFVGSLHEPSLRDKILHI